MSLGVVYRERGHMRYLVLVLPVVLLAGIAFAVEGDADSLVRSGIVEFMSTLQSGDGQAASQMFSEVALVQVEAMLNSIKQNLDREPEATINRLNGTGYSIDLENAENWETQDYLSATLSLPVITARYAPYEMEIDSVTVDGREAVIDLIFRTPAGVEIPQQAIMILENDIWRVASSMGITAFP
jgi:hypothetical protein